MLTSSLKLSVLCERLAIKIVISGLLIVNHGSGFVKAELTTCRQGHPRSLVGCCTNPFCFWFLDSFFGNG